MGLRLPTDEEEKDLDLLAKEIRLAGGVCHRIRKVNRYAALVTNPGSECYASIGLYGDGWRIWSSLLGHHLVFRSLEPAIDHYLEAVRRTL